MTKVIFLNGPPRCGKDTLAEILHRRLKTKTLKFADPLKRACHALFSLDVPNEYYDSMKDQKTSSFLDNTPRSVYISMSQEYIKKKFGDNFFGKILLNTIRENTKINAFVISDSGFYGESQVVSEAISPKNCLLIHIYRNGCNFSNDSRSYIKLPGVDSAKLYNNLSMEYLKKSGLTIISSWLEEKK